MRVRCQQVPRANYDRYGPLVVVSDADCHSLMLGRWTDSRYRLAGACTVSLSSNVRHIAKYNEDRMQVKGCSEPEFKGSPMHTITIHNLTYKKDPYS